MDKTCVIKRYREQRITFNYPVLYSTVVEYIVDNSKDSKVSRNKEEAYAFKSIEYAVKLLSILNKNTYEGEWKIVEIVDGKDLLVDEDIVNSYKNKHTIEKYRKEIVELNRKIAKLGVVSSYKKVTVEDVKIGAILFVVRAMKNDTHLSTEKVIIKSDIEELVFGIKAVGVDSVNISGDRHYSDGNLYLSDAGIIPNNYNKSKTFKTLEEAELYLEELKSKKQG